MIELSNEHLSAAIDDRGFLVHLAAPRGGNLLQTSFHQYHVTGGPTVSSLPAPHDPPAGWRYNGFELIRLTQRPHEVTAVHRSEHLQATVTYRLPPRAVLLQIDVAVKACGVAAQIIMPGMPTLRLADGFVDIIEDPRDLYCDGVELAHGRELPAWRVFFRKGYQQGLLLATRSKQNMAHFNFLSSAIEWRAHSTENYSTDTTRPVLDSAVKRTYRGQFELGPWSRRQHRALLRQAKLDKPLRVKHAPALGRPPGKLKGVVFHAAKVAGKAASKTYRPDRWLIADMPWSVSGKALLASTGMRPRPMTLKPRLHGPHRVIAGIADSHGLTLRVGGDGHTRYRMGVASLLLGHTGFALALSGRHKPHEVDFGVVDLNGQALHFGHFPDTHHYSVLDYVRFVPLRGRELARWQEQEHAEPVLPLSGLNDVPDIAKFSDGVDPDPQAYVDNLWAHAQAAVRKVYWRIDGQCSDYPSKHNTMRYISAKVHGVYSPQAKAYGRVLRKVNMLKLAVDAARRYDLELYGWMRFNSYMGNVASDFYKQHPEFWEEWDNGRRGGKLCIAHPEVRKHKIDILVEAAGYGLAGLCLGFLRHPPVLQYAPILCKSYQDKYGGPPPRDAKHPDPHHRFSLPDRGSQQPQYEQWWRHRAEYLTLFGRELRHALRQAKLGHVRIALWVRPNHCLFDGIDLPAWLSEKLCDEVVTETYITDQPDAEMGWETPQFKQMVRSAGVPLIRTLPPEIELARKDLKRVLDSGEYDGLCTYESDYTVLQSEFIDLYRSLRKV